ncbi:14411_t:CDS:2, partial [Entrophospora sp. SA101]
MEFTWKKTPDVVYKVKVGELGELLMGIVYPNKTVDFKQGFDPGIM